jgi:hypothetical protein
LTFFFFIDWKFGMLHSVGCPISRIDPGECDCGGGFAVKWMNAKNTIQTHRHKSVILVGPNHQIDRSVRQRPNGRISFKRLTNPNRSPKSKRPIKNRVAKQEILN